MRLLRKLLPLQFAVQLGSLRLISGTVLAFDDDEQDDDETDQALSATEVPFGFVGRTVDEVGLPGLEPLEDEDDDYDYEDAQGRAGRAAPR